MKTPPDRKQLQYTYCPITISRIKGKKAMKFGQLAEYNTRNFSKQNHAEIEAGRLVPDKSNYTVTI